MTNWIVRIGLSCAFTLLIFSCGKPGFTHRQIPESTAAFDTTRTDSTITIAAGAHYKRGFLHSIVFGKNYRESWAAPIEVPVINLRHEQGGLTPILRGGSNQSFTLRLEDSLKRQYVLRSVDKDPSRILPDFFRKKYLGSAMRDQTSTSFPYGALVAAELAERTGVLHTNPKFVMIPHDSAILGEFYPYFSGAMALLEERADEDWSHAAFFGNSSDIKGSENTMRRIAKSHGAKVDQKEFLRARLLDMLIGDWSRREDQWRWAWFKSEEGIAMKPIPRDRDHAFFRFRGVVPRLVSIFRPNLLHFGSEVRKVKQLNKSARRLDQVLLNELDHDDWIKISEDFYVDLTAQDIIESVDELPKPIEEIESERLIERLNSRKGSLRRAALQYYHQLARKVGVQGTDEADFFLIEKVGTDSISITVKSIDDQIISYNRVFTTRDTKEIHLLGLAGDDIFVSKLDNTKLKLHFYGGEGDNVYELVSGKGITVYDQQAEGLNGAKIDRDPVVGTANSKDWLGVFYFD